MCWCACARVHEASQRGMAPGARLIKKKSFQAPESFCGTRRVRTCDGKGWKITFRASKSFSFYAPFLSTSLPLFSSPFPLPHRHPLRPPFSISCCCCWCYEISITDYLVNFKINLGDLAEVALVCSDLNIIRFDADCSNTPCQCT